MKLYTDYQGNILVHAFFAYYHVFHKGFTFIVTCTFYGLLTIVGQASGLCSVSSATALLCVTVSIMSVSLYVTCVPSVSYV